MAVTSFNVSASDVKEHAPIDTSGITATSNPVNNSNLETYIDDASGDMAALLRKNGMDPSQLSDDATAQIQAAIKDYAVFKLLRKLGAVEERWRQYKGDWEDKYDKYDKQPSKVDGYSENVAHNINTDSDKPSAEFIGTDYEF